MKVMMIRNTVTSTFHTHARTLSLTSPLHRALFWPVCFSRVHLFSFAFFPSPFLLVSFLLHPSFPPPSPLLPRSFRFLHCPLLFFSFYSLKHPSTYRYMVPLCTDPIKFEQYHYVLLIRDMSNSQYLVFFTLGRPTGGRTRHAQEWSRRRRNKKTIDTFGYKQTQDKGLQPL